MILKHLVYSLALTLLLFHSSTAQNPDATPTREGTEASRELERKALSLLDEVVDGAQMLKRAENRIHIQAIAANLFWTRDEKRARALYKEAMKGLGEMMSSLDTSDPQYESLVQAPAQLRQEILQMIAAHDPQLALEFVRATRQPPSSRPDSGYAPTSNELQIELDLACRVARDDPKLALQIAEENMSKGISSTITGLISEIMNKDREGAYKLSNALIRRLRAENLLTNEESASTAASLLGVLNQPGIEGSTPQNSSKESAPVVSAQAYQELLEMVVTTALKAPLRDKINGNERNIAQTCLAVLEPMLPQVERSAPSQALALRRKLADYKKTLDPASRYWTENQELMGSGSVEELLDAASRAPLAARGNIYQQAASRAMAGGDVNRARQIIEDNVSDPSERQQMMANLDQEMFWQTVNEGKIDEARQMLSRRSSDEERVRALVQLAAMTANKGDKRSAFQLMEEARLLVGHRAGSYSELQAQLQVAHGYAALEPGRSFEILDAQVSQFNEMLTAAEVLNGFDQQYFKEGELVPQGSTLGNMVTQHINVLALLAKIDFDRTKLVAGRFQRPETRIMAGLSIAQGALNGSPEIDTSHGRAFAGRRFFNRRNKRVPAVRF